jgi:uncharacterized membrane protein
MPFSRPLTRLARDTRGGVTMIAAGGMLMSIGFAAFAVDLGSIYVRSRELQGIADAAALAAASDPANAAAAANAVIAANAWDGTVTVEIETGRYRFDTAVPVDQRFAASESSPDAVRVRLRSQAPLYFARLWREGGVDIDRVATASRARLASFSIGSRLAAVNGGLVGSYLSELAGTSLNLSVMDYDALLDADVDLLAFSEALATQLDVTALSFDEILASDVTAPQAFSALADALDTGNQASAASVVRQIAGKISGEQIDLSKLIDLGPYGAQDKAGKVDLARANGYEFAQAMLQLANGDRQVQLDAGASIPGLSDVDITIAVGDRPANSAWLTITDDGDTVIRTAQTRIFVDAKAPGNALLTTLGIGSVRLPLFIELASAEAKLHDIGCGTGPADRSVDLDVRPGVGHLSIADIDLAKIADHKTPMVEKNAAIVTTLLLKVSGKARADVGGVTWQRVAFGGSDITGHVVKTVSTSDIVAGVVQSLATTITLTVQPLGLFPIATGPVAAAVAGRLGVLAGPLDGLVNTLTDLVGVKLGQADVRVGGVRCGQPALVA